MNQFFASNIEGGHGTLSESESQHIRVLRKQVGDGILIVDGKGRQFKARITKLHKKASEVEIEEEVIFKVSEPLLDIAIAPTKSNDRFEWFLEKATELGVRNIYPFLSYHSERRMIKVERMEKIILSAMKQSLRLWLPRLHAIQSYEAIVGQQQVEHRFIAHLQTDQLHFKEAICPNQATIVLIGPEGGFSSQEITMAEANEFKSVTLGPQRLRTETAGILAAALFANS